MQTISYEATLNTPLHHGAGTSGNTSLLRTEDVIRPDGRQAQVPFVSGNSIRHAIRNVLAWHTVHHAGIQPGTLSKAAIDLLFSGGAVTSTGSQVNLEIARQVEEYYPALSLLGYAAQSDITQGTLEVSHLALICQENDWRYPGSHEFASIPAARFRGEEFGTRHDTTGTPTDQLRDIATTLTDQSTQMIYDMQVLKPGARMWGEIRTRHGSTEAQNKVLQAALTLLTEDGVLRLGAKNAVGYGQATPHGIHTYPDSLAWWEEHLAENAENIRTLITELAA